MTDHLYLGMASPYVFRVLIKASADFDPVVAAGADAGIVIVVKKPSGVVSEWSAVIDASSAASIALRHPFVASDLNERGSYAVWARFRFLDGRELRTRVGKTPTVLDTNQSAS